MPTIIKDMPTAENKPIKDLGKLFTKKIGWIAVVGISVVYLFWGFFKPVMKDDSILVFLMSSAISIIISYSIYNLLGLQGIMSGSLDPEVRHAQENHVAKVAESTEYIEYSDEWVELENKLALKKSRTHILISAGLKYSDFFTEDGDYTDYELESPDKNAPKYIKKRHRYKIKKLNQALHLKITPITMAKISAETTVDLDPNKIEKEPTEYLKAKALSSLWQKVLAVAVFGKIAWELGNGQFWESLFNGLLQLGIFLLFGAFNYYSNYIYMTTTYITNLFKKVNFNNRLISFGKKKREQEVITRGSETRRDLQQTVEISTTTETITTSPSTNTI